MKKYIGSIIKNPLFSGSVLMIGGSMGVNVVNYIYHLLMGRALGPVGYGTLSSLYSVVYLVGIVPISTSVAIVKFISSAKDKNEVSVIYTSLKRFIYKLAIIVSALLFVVSPFIAKFLNIEDNVSVFFVSFILFFLLIALINQSTSQGLLKFWGNVIPSLISALVKLLLGLLLVFLGFYVRGAMFALVIASISSFAYSWWYIKKHVKEIKSDYSIKPFLKYSIPVLIQSLAFTSIFTTDVILVKHFLSPFDAGIYAALSTLGKIIYFATSPVVATMFPIVSRKFAKGESYFKVFVVSLLLVTALSSIVVAFYYLFPGLAISLLYGSAYLVAKKELAWMGLFILFYTLSYLLVNFNLSLGRVKVVILPIVAAVTQIAVLWFFHADIMQVIRISMFISVLLFLVLFGIMFYNWRKGKKNAKG